MSSAPLQPVTGEVQTIHLTIGGMTCEGCAGILTKPLAAVPGVIGAEVSYEDGSAAVRIGEEAVVDVKTLGAVVQKAGYQVLAVDGGDHR